MLKGHFPKQKVPSRRNYKILGGTFPLPVPASFLFMRINSQMSLRSPLHYADTRRIRHKTVPYWYFSSKGITVYTMPAQNEYDILWPCAERGLVKAHSLFCKIIASMWIQHEMILYSPFTLSWLSDETRWHDVLTLCRIQVKRSWAWCKGAANMAQFHAVSWADRLNHEQTVIKLTMGTLPSVLFCSFHDTSCLAFIM